jgi:DNA-binding transcriptional LysR family regulator
LVKKEGRYLQPTEHGEQLLSYAKRMLVLNDEVIEVLNSINLEGTISIAIQEDFGEGVLTELLGRFSRLSPNVQLSTMVARYKSLISGVKEGNFDLAVTWDGDEQSAFVENITSLPIQWLAANHFSVKEFLDHDQALPLVMYDSSCLFKDKAIQALDAAGIKWRIAYTSQSLHGIWAAVKAGLGITVRSSVGIPCSVKVYKKELPSLGKLGVQIHRSSREQSEQINRLAEIITEQLQEI